MNGIIFFFGIVLVVVGLIWLNLQNEAQQEADRRLRQMESDKAQQEADRWLDLRIRQIWREQEMDRMWPGWRDEVAEEEKRFQQFKKSYLEENE